MNPSSQVDAIVVGAGFAGIYMLYRLREAGLSARVIERGSGAGGTWFWNRYPGARCDIQSMEYSYQFSAELQQEWDWSERYSTQGEILDYVNHVIDRFELREHMQFDTEVTAASWQEDASRWQVETSTGESFHARYLVMATGCLSMANAPDIKGLQSFEGDVYHTGRWPHEGVDFSGRNVAVIGTGSSAIQSIPVIAESAAKLTVFQRTPNYSVPAHNRPLTDDERNAVKVRYAEYRAENSATAFGADFRYNEALAAEATPEELREEYEARWQAGGLPFMAAYADLLFDSQANETAADFLRAKIADIVDDPDTAKTLTPHTVVGCKRLCVDTNYYATFNQPHVSLVDIAANPVAEITPGGLALENGDAFEADIIVFATGFDAMTGALLNANIQGRDGVALRDAWAEGPRSYLGLGIAGFPNLFTVTGPGSPSVLSNMLPSIEQHVDWIADCVNWMEQRAESCIEPRPDAQDAWVEHVNEVAHLSLYPNCNSWYLGANVPGKPRVFMPYLGYDTYVQRCREIVDAGYEGFALA